MPKRKTVKVNKQKRGILKIKNMMQEQKKRKLYNASIKKDKFEHLCMVI